MDNGELLARKQEALRACGEANESYLKAWWDCHKARRVCYEAREAYQEARQAYYMVWDELNQRVETEGR